MAIIGWLVCGLFLLWFTALLWFATYNPFGNSQFSGWAGFVVGTLLWSGCVWGWYEWASVISINLN